VRTFGRQTIWVVTDVLATVGLGSGRYRIGGRVRFSVRVRRVTVKVLVRICRREVRCPDGLSPKRLST